MPRCAQVNANGTPCGKPAAAGCNMCSVHKNKAGKAGTAVNANAGNVVADVADVPDVPDVADVAHVELPMPPLPQPAMDVRTIIDENARLKSEVQTLIDQVAHLSMTLKLTRPIIEETARKHQQHQQHQQHHGPGYNGKGTKKRNITEKSVWRRAKAVFYREFKEKPEINAMLLETLKKAQLIAADAQKPPWQNLKILSDGYFLQLGDEDRQSRFDIAKAELERDLSN